MAQSNREILLACMIEDMAAVERIDEIAAVPGVDLLAVGPSDLSRSLGVSGTPDHPRLVAAIDRVREAVKKGAGCRLALPLNHAAFPRNAAQLKELGAGYTNCAPTRRRACCARCRSRRRRSAACWADGCRNTIFDPGAGSEDAGISTAPRTGSCESSTFVVILAASGSPRPIYQPPSTPIAWPVTKAASSEAR